MKTQIFVLSLLLVASLGFAKIAVVNLPNCTELEGYEKLPITHLDLSAKGQENLVSCLTTRIAKMNGTYCMLDVNFTYPADDRQLTALVNCPQLQPPAEPEPKTECPKCEEQLNPPLYQTLENKCKFIEFTEYDWFTRTYFNETHAKIDCGLNFPAYIPLKTQPEPPEQFSDIYMTVGKSISLILITTGICTFSWLVFLSVWDAIKRWITNIAEERMKEKCKNYKRKEKP